MSEELRDVVVITEDGKVQFYGSDGELIGELTDDDFPAEIDREYVEVMATTTVDPAGLAQQFHATGAFYARKEKFDKALIYLQKAADLDSNNVDIQFDLGVTYEKMGNHRAAETLYKRVLELNPNNFQAWNNLGNVYRHLQNWTEAERCLKQAIRISPYQPNPYYNLANLYVTLGREDKVGLFHKIASRLEQFPQDREVKEFIQHLIREGKI